MMGPRAQGNGPGRAVYGYNWTGRYLGAFAGAIAAGCMPRALKFGVPGLDQKVLTRCVFEKQVFHRDTQDPDGRCTS